MITIPDAVLAAAVDRLIAEQLTPAAIDALVKARIDERIGTLTVEQVATRWHLDDVTTRRLLKKFRAKKCLLSAKSVRYRVEEIERLEKEREVTGKLTRVSRAPFSLAA